MSAWFDIVLLAYGVVSFFSMLFGAAWMYDVRKELRAQRMNLTSQWNASGDSFNLVINALGGIESLISRVQEIDTEYHRRNDAALAKEMIDVSESLKQLREFIRVVHKDLGDRQEVIWRGVEDLRDRQPKETAVLFAALDANYKLLCGRIAKQELVPEGSPYFRLIERLLEIAKRIDEKDESSEKVESSEGL